ncbi:hypothetical protein [Streptomyces sp. NPDC006879]|uniref:hypothetical protein n=1 Tax=Streptomyces sp. NPDC006879 TaxID=3364767 RepID=UPI0036BAA10D
MISEPELVGDWGVQGAPAQEALLPQAKRGPGWAWRGWLGGALAASALWAGGLYAFSEIGRPPRIDYRASQELCAQLELPATQKLTGELSEGNSVFRGHPALDFAHCTRQRSPEGDEVDGWVRTYEVRATVELHRESDPASEFEANTQLAPWMDGREVRSEQVPGLGERALMLTSSAWDGPMLRVLEGGAVFTLQVEPSWSFQGNADGGVPTGDLPDDADLEEAAVQSAMIQDTRALMAALRR